MAGAGDGGTLAREHGQRGQATSELQEAGKQAFPRAHSPFPPLTMDGRAVRLCCLPSPGWWRVVASGNRCRLLDMNGFTRFQKPNPQHFLTDWLCRCRCQG